jgi:Asp-tRNA(Asn)/Glu-tRNA(Gln) amidotransferase A subunit family amidase
MLETTSPLTQLQKSLASGATTATEVAGASIRAANGNASRNTYLYLDEPQLQRQAASLSRDFPDAASRPPLFGVPISLKDCFDLAGTVTTCGTRYYAEHNPPAAEDSAMAARLRASGALIVGKTHLHPLAYGLTGENPDYGDCLQACDPALLTGGSSSGAAASVQEGSALAAIGTDTGCSIRFPAALCGLTGYRASHSLAYGPGPWPTGPEGLWAGGVHLATSYDCPGFVLRDPRDAAPIANALFGVPPATAPKAPRIGCVPLAFLGDFTPEVRVAYVAWQEQFARMGASVADVDPHGWQECSEIYTAIQAYEASQVHAGHYDEFGLILGQRLHWGASLTPAEIAALLARQAVFRAQMAALLLRIDYIVLPCAPIQRLAAGEDHTYTRKRVLRYNTPFSLAGFPAVALPGEILGAPLGTGVQIGAIQGGDAELLAYVAALAQFTVDHPETLVRFQS